jgi:hypothetical protein
MLRIAALVLAVLALDAAGAGACPVSAHPCNKNRRRPEPFEETAIGYAATVRGTIPQWSYDRIAAFLARGPWDPITADHTSFAKAIGIRPGEVIWVKPPRIVFATAEAAAEMHIQDSIVLIRRIEKHGSAILVDLDGLTFRLTVCTRRPGHACLVQTKLDFDPVEPEAGHPD